jgi:hypothetical protein
MVHPHPIRERSIIVLHCEQSADIERPQPQRIVSRFVCRRKERGEVWNDEKENDKDGVVEGYNTEGPTNVEISKEMR